MPRTCAPTRRLGAGSKFLGRRQRPAADGPLMLDEWPPGDLFDQDYLDFHGPRLGDEASDREAALVWELLDVEPDAEVLDLACGHGRIVNRLADHGARVTGLDVTPMFLERARADAAVRGVSVEYVSGDVRTLPWVDHFDAVVSWFTAYGYFDDEQNRAVLSEVHRVLRPGGRFLVELNHKDGLLPTWLPATVERLGEAVMIDEREWDPVTGRSNNWRTIIRDGERARCSSSPGCSATRSCATGSYRPDSALWRGTPGTAHS